MVKSDQIEQIKILLDAKFARHQTIVSDLLEREHALRADLRKLEHQSRMVDHNAQENMQAIGADVIWKAWLGRTKAALNLELAQVLAQKESVLKNVRKSFGKKQIGQELLLRSRKKERQRLQDTALRDILENSIRR